MIKLAGNFLEKSVFKLKNSKCRCLVDTEHYHPGQEPREILKVFSEAGSSIDFSYTSKEGLAPIGARKNVDRNVLGTLLSLPSKRGNKDLISFIEEYGFLWETKNENGYCELYKEDFIKTICRLQTIVELLAQIGSRTPNYCKMLNHILHLMGTPRINFTIEKNGFSYSGCRYGYVSKIDTILQRSPDNITTLFDPHTGTITFPSINFKNYSISVEDWQDIQNCELDNPYSSELRRASLFFKDYSSDPDLNDYADFIYFFILDWHRSPFIYDNVPDLGVWKGKEQFTSLILRVAKKITEEELNHHLQEIYPLYNGETMQSTWKVSSLITGLYFSLFFLNSETELYRPCANRNCSKYFLINRSSSTKRFCSPQCSNAEKQRRHRERKKENMEN